MVFGLGRIEHANSVCVGIKVLTCGQMGARDIE